MTNMGNVGSNNGMVMGMGKEGVAGVQNWHNMSAPNKGFMPSAVSPAYANPSAVSPAHANPSAVSPAYANPSAVSPAYANPSWAANSAPIASTKGAGAGVGHSTNMVGSVLVLYILLVIITRSVWI